METYYFLTVTFFIIHVRHSQTTTISNIYQFKDYNIQCSAEEAYIVQSVIQCGMKCTATLCAGYIYDSNSKQCRLCPGQKVTGLTFADNLYTLRTTAERSFDCNPQVPSSYVLETPNSLPFGSVLYVSMAVSTFEGYILLGNPTTYSFVLRIHLSLATLLNAQDHGNWSTSIYIGSPIPDANQVQKFWILVALDGFHVYIDKVFQYLYPNSFPQIEMNEIRVNGNIQSVTIAY